MNKFTLKLVVSKLMVSGTALFSLFAYAENVEVVLTDKLDGNLSGYCIDIKGGNQSVDPANGLQAHTCYSYRGSLGTDQIFDTARFTDNILYMPEYEVCAEVAAIEAGASVGLASCDGNDKQSFTFAGEGAITPSSATHLCFTAGTETKMGRGGTSAHQIKTLSLEACSDELAAYQQWRTRASED